jgi:hypothetical protein
LIDASLKDCKATDSKDACDKLQSTITDKYTTAKKAATTADTTYTTCTGKTYKAPKTVATECAADKTAKTTADAKEA